MTDYNTLEIDVMPSSIYCTLFMPDGVGQIVIDFFVYKADMGVMCCEYLEHPCLSPYEKIIAILPAIGKSKRIHMIPDIVCYIDYLERSSDRDGMYLCQNTLDSIGQSANVIGEKIYDMALSGNVKIFKGESLYEDMMMLHKYTELMNKVRLFALMRYGGHPDYLEVFRIDNSGGGLN